MSKKIIPKHIHIHPMKHLILRKKKNHRKKLVLLLGNDENSNEKKKLFATPFMGKPPL